MPNWCNNSITIKGPAEKITALWGEAIKEENGLLNSMVPMPDGLIETVKGSGDELQTEVHDGFTNWYDWCVSRWGTKWDVSTEGLEIEQFEDGTAEITGWFDSAWAPPLTAFDTYIQQNEDVHITCYYEEGGMDYAGKWVDGDDQYLDDIHGKVTEYIKTGNYPDDELFRDIDDYFDLVEQRREYIEEDLKTEEA